MPPQRAYGFARQELSGWHRSPLRVTRRCSPLTRPRRYLSSQGEVKVKGRNPRPALGPLADQRFTRGAAGRPTHHQGCVVHREEGSASTTKKRPAPPLRRGRADGLSAGASLAL